MCARFQIHHTSKADLIEENKKVVKKLESELKDLKRKMYDKKSYMTDFEAQATEKKIERGK